MRIVASYFAPFRLPAYYNLCVGMDQYNKQRGTIIIWIGVAHANVHIIKNRLSFYPRMITYNHLEFHFRILLYRLQ